MSTLPLDPLSHIAPKTRIRLTWRKRLAVALGSLAATLVAAEVCLRCAVFTTWGRATPGLARLSRPGQWGDFRFDDNYWIVHAFGAEGSARRETTNHHAVLGWLPGAVDGVRLRHVEGDLPPGKHPILMFGDSYTECMTAPEECWQELMRLSLLSPHVSLLNFGARGYGVDQMLLLLDRTIDQYTDKKPLVVVAIMIDDDFDRAMLRVAAFPRPQMKLVNGSIDPHVEPVPSPAQFFAGGGPLGRSSLLAAWLGYQVPNQFKSWRARRQRQRDSESQAMATALVERLAAVVADRQLQLVLVLFHDYPSLMDPASSGWREPLLIAQAQRLGVPCLVLREGILDECKRRGIDPFEMYGGAPELLAHWNARGNQVVFTVLGKALLPYLRLDPDTAQAFASAPADDFLPRSARIDDYRGTLGGSEALVRVHSGSFEPFPDPADAPRFVVRIDANGPTAIHWKLAGTTRALRARAQTYPFEDAPRNGVIGLEFLVDGRSVLRTTVRGGEPAISLQVDTRGGQELSLMVDDGGDGAVGDALVLLRPEFE